MPYKDKEIRQKRAREKLELLKQDNEKYQEYLTETRERQRIYRSKETPEQREIRLHKRREIRKQNSRNKTPPKRLDPQEKTERRRQSARKYASKKYHENPQGAYEYYKQYWKNTTPERKATRRARNTEQTRKFRMAHPDAPKIYHQRNKEKWTNGIDCRNPEIWKVAEDKAIELISSLGYTDIYRPDFYYFYFDAMAKMNGKITVFQITTLRDRQIKRKHIELVRYIGWDYFIIHVKPNFEVAYVTRIDPVNLGNKKVVNYHFTKGTEYKLS